MKIYNKKINVFFFAIILFLTSGCSTKKNTYFHRKYHNITARYNGYFNGNQSLKYGVSKMENNHKDDYSKILSIYKTSSLLESKSHHPYMDQAIKKGSIVIQKHSIRIRNTEYCKWIDDSYFLVAKSHFYKGDFFEARQTFEYIKNNFKKTYKAYESQLWTARCNIELKEYKAAEMILDGLRSKRKFPEELTKDLHLTYAHLYIQQNDLLAAVDEIRSACNLIKSNNKKYRLHYIIAQIYKEYGNKIEAKKYFEFVLKSNAEYEMIFNSKLNLALSLKKQKDLNQMKNDLRKMTNDEKNKEYLDQIYFTLAEIHMVERDSSLAIVNYNKSTQYSSTNEFQKSTSFLQLGKIYFNKGDYLKAKTYYDSACFFMQENNSEYKTTKQKQGVLDNLSKCINTINLQDSLRSLARMGETERNKTIQKIIEDLIEKEQEELREQQNRSYASFENRNGRNNNFGENVSAGQWYFYNPATLSYGLSEFRKTWGKRKLEDDWRRSNKKSLSNIEEDTSSSVRGSQSQNKKSIQYYLEKIPLTDEQIAVSDQKIINACYQAYLIYKGDLNKMIKSEKMLEEIIERYPNNSEWTPMCYFLLYSSKKTHDPSEANKIKDLLIQAYKETPYAKSLLDTNYLNKALAESNIEETEYKRVLDLYANNNFLDAFNESLKKAGENNKYSSRYYLINILSEFKNTQDTALFKLKLKKGVEMYKNDDTGQRCLKILETINNPDSFNRRNEIAILKTPYRFDEKQDHYVVIITPKKNTDVNFIKTLISDFNSEKFSNEIIEINAMMLGIEKHLILIKTFKSKLKSMGYHRDVFLDDRFLEEINKTEHESFVISEENFKEFYRKKDLTGYKEFYNNKYIE